MMGCLQDPDCPGCFCNQDPTGCNDYITAVINNIYCGSTCSTDCSAFCTSMDPLQITTACDNCTFNPSQPDIDAFSLECQSSVACVNFLNQIATCP
jgi:hypothetical protein